MGLSSFRRNIKALRDINGNLSQQQLADSLGILQGTVSGWEREGKYPRNDEVLELIYSKYGVTEQDLFGYSDGLYAKHYQIPQMKKAEGSESYAPVLGNIAAGDPKEAIEYTDQKLWIPPEILERDPDTFYLRVTSDSLDQTDFKPDVYAAISPNSEVHNGDIAAVKVNGDDATLKVYFNHNGVIVLEPRSSNPDYRRIVIDSSNPDSVYFRLIGKAVWPYYPPRF